MKTMSTNPPRIPQELFAQAAARSAMSDSTRHALEMILVRGHSLSHIARATGVKHRQQLDNAKRRLMAIIATIESEA